MLLVEMIQDGRIVTVVAQLSADQRRRPASHSGFRVIDRRVPSRLTRQQSIRHLVDQRAILVLVLTLLRLIGPSFCVALEVLLVVNVVRSILVR